MNSINLNNEFPLVTERDKKIIAMQDNGTLTKWACDINTWKWPAELPGHDNGKWHYSPKYFKIFGICLWRISSIRDTRESQMAKYITRLVGEKAVSRLSNKYMSDEEFECWWTCSYDEYWERYGNKRIKEGGPERGHDN